MFTGIIDHCGYVAQINAGEKSRQFFIQTRFDDLHVGESIALNGTCLTVTEVQDDTFCCDVSSETLAHTTLGKWRIGEKINLERALRPIDRMGGHFVTGHVDQIAKVAEKYIESEYLVLNFAEISSPMVKFLVKKGSVAVDGVSLTVNTITRNSFAVMLIPHTLACTNLKDLCVNDFVNIEFDMLAKFVLANSDSHSFNTEVIYE